MSLFKNLIVGVSAVALLLSCSFTQAISSDLASYEKGVTVRSDPASPTGYTATFIYEEEESYQGVGEVVKVELYSDCFLLFDPSLGEDGVIDAGLAKTPYEYTAGLAPAGGDGTTTFYAEMTKVADGLWGIQIPLSSGAFVYNFRVTDADGNFRARLDDPNNPTLVNSATGIRSLSSLVYVPYDAEKMGTSEWADRSVELPIADTAKKGTVETVSYTGADGTEHGLALYLPAGYDATREEPYKVLYLSHGTSGDIFGDELRWMNEGAVANIMDNLIAEGKCEPFVVVTMNNQQYGQGAGHSGPNWKYSEIEVDQIEYIMPYVESNYNVATSAEGRAYAGLSMGGSTTSNMLMHHPDLFSYYGIWSYANVDGAYGSVAGILDESVQQRLASYKDSVNIMLAAGKWDFGLTPVVNFGKVLDQIGIENSLLIVPAAHDWENWQLTFANAAENFFWK